MAKQLPARPKLADPASQPRHHLTGAQQRGKVVYEQRGGEGFGQWEVEVTPLEGATNVGRGIDAGRHKPRALFEIRAAYYATGRPEFGSQPNTRFIPHTHTEDQELALAIARRLTELLRAGQRDIDILEIGRAAELLR